jgi:hypothetical protein
MWQVKHMHLVSSFEGFALYRQALKLRQQLSDTKEPAQYLTLREKIFRLLSFAKEKLELATFSIPVPTPPPPWLQWQRSRVGLTHSLFFCIP